MKIGDRTTVVFENGQELQGFLDGLWDELRCANGEALIGMGVDIFPKGQVPKPTPRCPECKGNLLGAGNDWCDCPGSDEMADHPYQRRGEREAGI